MGKKASVVLSLVVFFAFGFFISSADGGEQVKSDVVSVRVEQQYDVVRPGGESALAMHFKLDKDWHFYASAATAPGGMNLKLKASGGESIIFSEQVFLPQFLDHFPHVDIHVGNLPIIGAFGKFFPEGRGRIIRKVRIKEVNPEEKFLSRIFIDPIRK